MLDPVTLASAHTVHTTGVNWQAVGALSGPVIGVVVAIGKYLGRKLDNVGKHLERQDVRGRRMDRRMSRVEVTLGLPALPVSDDD
jgi:hypothetical protein